MRARIPLLAALAVASVGAAGCGGGGSTASTTASSADFVAQGNQICKEDNAKFKALGTPSSSDVRPFLQKLIPLLDDDLSRLKDLEPPSDEAATFDAWIAHLEQGTELTKKAADAPSSDAATKILQPSRSINKQADAEAKKLGLDECLTSAGSGS
jgi:hypothetical protein